MIELQDIHNTAGTDKKKYWQEDLYPAAVDPVFQLNEDSSIDRE